MRKIQFGCGGNRLNGWENYDYEIDISKPLPFNNDSVDAILAEHVLEHINIHQAWNFIEECYRILKKDAVKSIIFNHGHQTMWEQSSLDAIVQSMGFNLLNFIPDIMQNTLNHHHVIGVKINNIETIFVDCQK